MVRASHFQEWRSSAVHPDIIELNVESLSGDAAYESLLYGLPDSERLNNGRLGAGWIRKYSHLESGGWWASGIDILTGQPSRWGCLKPDKPRIDLDGMTLDQLKSLCLNQGINPDGWSKSQLVRQLTAKGQKSKPLKYEHPAKCPTEIFALRVPDDIWQAIGDKYGIAPYCLLPTKDTDTPGVTFWQWVLDNPSIALLITEGAKKAGSLLTAGYAAIALPGIYSGFRQDKEWGNAIGLPYLIPQLLPFCGGGREVVFFFDQDSKPKTIKNVRRAIEKTGKLLGYKGCKVSVARWSDYWKGIDDFVVSQGIEALDRVFSERISLDAYKIENFSALTPDLKINERYISQSLNPPENAKIIGIKAPKGTGKTEFIAAKIAPLLAKGDRVLVLTHRVQLGLELSRRFGVNYRSELVTSEDGSLLGYVLCVDSLHGKANPKFNPLDWENTTIIIDECEQVFWHLLNSPTCEKYRVKIIDCLRELFRIAVSTGGKIYLSDADLSMNAISYVQSLIGYSLPTYVIENSYKSPLKRNLYLFGGNNPSSLIQELEIAVNRGQKVIVHTDGQKHKSNWGTRNLEYYFKKKYPNLKILRIDSESVSDRSHPAYGCMGNLNQILSQYDLVICSPVIETGISIDGNHFDAVFAISHGVQSVDSLAQTLARVRADIPRYIWVSEYSPNRIGNGSTDLKQLLAGEHFKAKFTIRTLQSVGLREIPEFSFLEDGDKYSPSLSLWAKNAVKINLEAKNYRESLMRKLEDEGYKITPIAPGDKESIESLKDDIKSAKNENYSGHKKAVLNADSLSNCEYDSLKEKRELTEGERNQLKRARIERTYGINLTDELITKDDDNWYPKIRLHYFLSVGNQFLADRDSKKIDDSLENGEGKIFKPDMNRSLLSAKINLLKVLNIEQFLDSDREFTSDDLAEWFETLKKIPVSQIKSILGFTLSMGDTPIAFAQRLLAVLGLKLSYVSHRRFPDGSRQRVYRGCDPLADGRGEVFDRWLERDRESLEDSSEIAA
ncbi:plasmid replication protein, CyRepA1 family [Microcystis sp.]|uniref:plasmid replication protein, CyRepA1 family n=1 Tax=Microcystis sp. TaxID=1127 RepID=UPI003AF6250C